ncbi:MAG TPA: NBR1-Ig-like domain-containing protein [Anaerolineales bacterium]|nr:NBR1-Ig-like domain-containing protein [Anaerolineales bacterium]
MLKFRLIVSIQTVMILGALLLSACGASEPPLTPTVPFSADEIRTQAVGTFSSDLTATAFAAPTNTPVSTLTPAPTLAAPATSTGGVALGSTAPAATASCYGLAFVSDVSIPDNTPVTAGQSFTKTWKVKNSGSCAWDAGFKFAFTGGDAMGGTTYTVPSSVAAGAVTDISVTMTAPSKTGTIRGNWRMSTASGQFFGDEVYVQVVIGGGTAATSTSGPATSSTSTTAPSTSTSTTATSP